MKNLIALIFLTVMTFGMATLAASSPFKLSTLKSIITMNNIRSVSELLPLLPESTRSHYILAFKSDSLQNGTYQRPRVLLFSEDGKFVMTFNGDPEQYGYETIETMTFIDGPNDDRFVFEEIVMEKDLQERLQFLNDAKLVKDAKGLVLAHQDSGRIGPNPAVCKGCHLQDPRPNWNQGKFWPGIYGKIDSVMWNAEFTVYDPVTGKPFVDSDRADTKNYIEFVGNVVNHPAHPHPRYRHLVGLKLDAYKQPPLPQTQEFTQLIATLNAKRIARILTKSPRYPEFKTQLFYFFGYCPVNMSNEKLERAKSLESLLKPYGVDVSVLSTHFYKGPGNELVNPRAGQDLLVKMLFNRDPRSRSAFVSCQN